MAVTFEPHPAEVLDTRNCPPRLTTSVRRRELLEALGVDRVVDEPTPDLLGLDGDAFIEHLRASLPFDVVVEGPGDSVATGPRASRSCRTSAGTSDSTSNWSRNDG